MSKKGTIISLAVHGLGKKIFRPGEVVTEENFPAGNFDKLVADGHILLSTESKGVQSIADEKARAIENAAAAEKLANEEKEKAAAAAAEAEKEALNAATLVAQELEIEIPDGSTSVEVQALIDAYHADQAAKKRLEIEAEANELEIEFTAETSDDDLLQSIAAVRAERELEAAKIAIAAYDGKKSFVDGSGATKLVKKFEDINVKQLVAELRKVEGLEFNSNSSKTILFYKWISLPQ